MRWTPEVIARLGVDMDAKIALDCGCSRERVRQVRLAHGISKAKQHKKRRNGFSEKLNAVAIDWENTTDREIATLVGCSSTTVLLYRNSNNKPKRKRSHHCEVQINAWMKKDMADFCVQYGGGNGPAGVRRALEFAQQNDRQGFAAQMKLEV